VRVANVPIALALVAAPWFVLHPGDARLNSMVCGIAVTLLSFVRGRRAHRFDGGWSMLWRTGAHDDRVR
jgi:hypothetical protein